MHIDKSMEGGSVGHLHEEVRSLKRSLHRFTIGVTVLSVVVVAIFIALIAVGASQHNSIKNLRARAGIIKDPKVAFATGYTDRNIQGLNYGGSLFRGSGFCSTRKALPGNLTDHAAVGYNKENVFIIGGANDTGNVTDEVWMYDAVFHSYTKKASMPEPRYRFGATLVKDKIYVVGGRNSSVDANEALTKSTFIYDIQKKHGYHNSVSDLQSCPKD